VRYEEFLISVSDKLADMDRHPSVYKWRRGQMCFNMLRDARPVLAEKVRATDKDPFYDDTRIPAFFMWLIAVWGP
jgi:hypothetical protein